MSEIYATCDYTMAIERPFDDANRQIIVEVFPPYHRGASCSSDRHYIVEIVGGSGAALSSSVPDRATVRD